MSFPLRQWKDPDVEEVLAQRLADGLVVPIQLARLLAARGFSDVTVAGRFLNPRLSDLGDPFDLPGVNESVSRIWRAIDDGQKIVVFGDYDVDGVTSSALLIGVLRKMGARGIESFIPHRVEDGYGMSIDALTRCIDVHSPDLIITVDCGTNSVDSADYACARGVDVIVTDHHEPKGATAGVFALINPKAGGSENTQMLAGVGVAFKLCHGLIKQGLKDGRAVVSEIDLRDWLDLVAAGTVADIVPLTGENRILVRHGLGYINRGLGESGGIRTGLGALMTAAGFQGEVDCFHLGFVVGPRLNAAGRIGTAKAAFELLMAEDGELAGQLAGELEESNRERKAIEDKIKREAEKRISEYFDAQKTFGIVAYDGGWHPGVIGIVASRLASRFRRPVVVLARGEDGNGKGSCRSIDCVNILEVLDECSDLLSGYGGHKMAAGLQIKPESIPEFARRFDSICAGKLRGVDLRSVQQVDAWVSMGDVDDDLCKALSNMSPFGMGNPVPVLGVRGVTLAGPPVVMGKTGDHLKMSVAGGGTQVEAVAFGMGRHSVPDGELDIIFNLKNNFFRGRHTLQMNVVDMRPSLPNRF